MNRAIATLAAGALLGMGVAACDSEKGGYGKDGERFGKDGDRPAASDGSAMGGLMRDDATRTPMGTHMGQDNTTRMPMGQGNTTGMPMGQGNTTGMPMGQGDTSGTVTGGDTSGSGTVADQTKKNVSPMSQGNNAADLETTQIIRRALLEVDGLSMSAKNLTIITNDRVVTLRGSVATKAEREAVLAAANSAAGKNRVDDQIVVDTGSTARNE